MRKHKNPSDAGKRSGETRTDALLPQPETGKISCVHHLSCARLTPGVEESNAATGMLVPVWDLAACVLPGRSPLHHAKRKRGSIQSERISVMRVANSAVSRPITVPGRPASINGAELDFMASFK